MRGVGGRPATPHRIASATPASATGTPSVRWIHPHVVVSNWKTHSSRTQESLSTRTQDSLSPPPTSPRGRARASARWHETAQPEGGTGSVSSLSAAGRVRPSGSMSSDATRKHTAPRNVPPLAQAAFSSSPLST